MAACKSEREATTTRQRERTWGEQEVQVQAERRSAGNFHQAQFTDPRHKEGTYCILI